jgi:hypothetical protein
VALARLQEHAGADCLDLVDGPRHAACFCVHPVAPLHGPARRRCRGRRLAPVATGLLLLALTLGGAPRAASGDAYLCYGARPARGVPAVPFTPRAGVTLVDRFSTTHPDDRGAVDVLGVDSLCAPAEVDHQSPDDPATHLEDYGLRQSRLRPPQPRFATREHTVAGSSGEVTLRITRAEGLLVPTAAAFGSGGAPAPGPSAVDHFQCYRARALGPVSPKRVVVQDGFGERVYDIGKPQRLCLPADKNGEDPAVAGHPGELLCLRARIARTRPRQERPTRVVVSTQNQFGAEVLEVASPRELCLPATEAGPAPTTTATRTPRITPTRTVTATRTLTPLQSPSPVATPNAPLVAIRVAPSEATAGVGESAHFTAEAEFQGGTVLDYTQQVVWSVGGSAAVAPNGSGDRGRIDTVDGGIATISAADPLSGVTSTASGDDATLTVEWNPVRITIRPPLIARLPGEVKHFWATAHFASGFSREISDVVWSSSDPAVATAPNDPADPNRMDLHAIGTTMIAAADTRSGLTSTATGDDATLRVTGPLQSITVGPFAGWAELGGYEQFTAIGYYHFPPPLNYVLRNMTQDVIWSTTDPSIAVANNPPGDRSRIVGVSPGIVGVFVTDPNTGVRTSTCDPPIVPWCGPRLAVLGDLQSIFVAPTGRPRSFYHLRTGDFARVAAIGLFEGGGVRHITQESLFASSDPFIFETPNAPGDRGRIRAAGGGIATLTATHTATGIVSAPFQHLVYGDVLAIDIPNHQLRPRRQGLYGLVPFRDLTATYGHGQGPLRDWEAAVDDPTIATVDPLYPRWVTPLRPGTVSIGARDPLTGVESTERLTVSFYGDFRRLILSPDALALRVGDSDYLTALSDHDGDVQVPVTRQATYFSSDPTVVAVPNEWWQKSRIVGLEPGEAVVSAEHSGHLSSTSGDDTFVTVVGPLTALTVTAPDAVTSVGRWTHFTATGTDAQARTINLTQRTNWSTSDASVARALNPIGARSRIEGLAPGTVTITAADPVSGLTSTASGADATLTVLGAINTLLLLPETLRLGVGDEDYVTALGIAPNGALNLTQEVTYASDAPAVVAVTNTPDDKSRLTALAAGTARITAVDPVSGMPSSQTVVTVTGP